MIELSNIIGFIATTIVLVLLEWWIYGDKKRAFKLIPLAMLFSGVLHIVWAIL